LLWLRDGRSNPDLRVIFTATYLWTSINLFAIGLRYRLIGSASIGCLRQDRARIASHSGISHGQWVDEQLLAYPLGSKLLDRATDLCRGRRAGNHACATFARLGFKTALIGKTASMCMVGCCWDWLDDNAITFSGRGWTDRLQSDPGQPRQRPHPSLVQGCNNELESVWPSPPPGQSAGFTEYVDAGAQLPGAGTAVRAGQTAGVSALFTIPIPISAARVWNTFGTMLRIRCG